MNNSLWTYMETISYPKLPFYSSLMGDLDFVLLKRDLRIYQLTVQQTKTILVLFLPVTDLNYNTSKTVLKYLLQ